MKRALLWLSLGSLVPGTSEVRGSDEPELSAPSIVSLAGRFGGKVSPGEIVALYPSHVGPAAIAGAQLGRDGKVTTLLGDTRVWFDGVPAPMAYTVNGEVGAVVPYDVAHHTTTEVVVEFQGKRSPPVTLAVVDATPALFTLDASGQGQAAMLNETGCCNSARNPAARGSIGVLYATGEGQTTPPGITGSVTFHDRIKDYPVPQSPVQVTVGGVLAEIVYSGEAPHAIAGLLQVNFRVPANAPIGDAIPLVLTVGGVPSSSQVTMAVRSATRRILVVDPNSANRAWFEKVLAGNAFEVFTAPEATEALSAAQPPVDLVILSLAIPQEDRQAVVHSIQATHPQVRIAAIATSAWLSPATLKAADLLGAQAVFVKPMAPQTVLARIRDLLRSRHWPD
jgi:uncharacterized protein (TIGR03437 family)